MCCMLLIKEKTTLEHLFDKKKQPKMLKNSMFIAKCHIGRFGTKRQNAESLIMGKDLT